MSKLIAYHDDPALKEKYLARVRAHRAADELIKGATDGRLDDGTFRGCAVACTMETYSHKEYETQIGFPRVLARLEDTIFERLPQAEAMAWPEQFLNSVEPGADLSGVINHFLYWLLVDPKDGVIRFAKNEKTKTAIETVGALYKRKIDGDEPLIAEWRSARSAAYAADAAYAAYAADAAYAAYAADAAYAAYADAASAYAAAKAQTAKLLELLRAAPKFQEEAVTV